MAHTKGTLPELIGVAGQRRQGGAEVLAAREHLSFQDHPTATHSLLLKGLRKVIATALGNPDPRIIIPLIFALSLNHPQQNWVYLAVAPAAALSLALWVPSGRWITTEPPQLTGRPCSGSPLSGPRR